MNKAMHSPYTKILSVEKRLTASRSEFPAAECLSSSLVVFWKISVGPAHRRQSFATFPTLPETSRFSNEEVPRVL
jgi:hypothetical protein